MKKSITIVTLAAALSACCVPVVGQTIYKVNTQMNLTGVNNDGVAVGFPDLNTPYYLWRAVEKGPNQSAEDLELIGGIGPGDGIGGHGRFSDDGKIISAVTLADVLVSKGWTNTIDMPTVQIKDMYLTTPDVLFYGVAVGVDTETGKTLVIYFSATGNTKDAAEYIAAETGADIFEITPAQEYTSDDLNYNDDSSRVSKEHNDESLRDVELTTTEVPGWESYDTVFVGYPIWWGTSAWPVDSFVKANDFTGKTVYPFCTSASSGLGRSADDLASEAGSGDWKDGQRFSSGVTQQDVADWISGLGLGQ